MKTTARGRTARHAAPTSAETTKPRATSYCQQLLPPAAATSYCHQLLPPATATSYCHHHHPCTAASPHQCHQHAQTLGANPPCLLSGRPSRALLLAAAAAHRPTAPAAREGLCHAPSHRGERDRSRQGLLPLISHHPPLVPHHTHTHTSLFHSFQTSHHR